MLRNDLTQAELMEELDYNPETGIFIRIKQKPGRAKVGDVAGSQPRVTGHVGIKINHTLYQAHRLAWLYVYGEWPDGLLDHKNGIASDNRIDNLRVATNAQNMHNRKLNGNNKSGVKGLCYDPKMEKWVVQVRYNKQTFKKRFKEFEDAEWYANMLREELHGEYARAE